MKQKRQNEILRLITEYDIGTQEELAYRLGNAGFEVTQATISRDIRELKLSKVSTKDRGQKYAAFHREEGVLDSKYSRVLKEGLSSIGRAESLVVVRTVAGMAMAVAAALDAMKMDEIVGTIAGDDTIMMAVRTKEDTGLVMKKIEEMIENVK